MSKGRYDNGLVEVQNVQEEAERTEEGNIDSRQICTKKKKKERWKEMWHVERAKSGRVQSNREKLD